MKKLIQIAVLIVISTSTVNAQKVSQETIDRAIDKLNCLATENSVTESKKAWKCDCASNPNYDIIKSAIPADLANTSALSSEINHIKNHSVPAATRDDLIKFLSEDVFTKQPQYAKLYSFASARSSKEAFKEWKRKLKADISEIVSTATLEQEQSENEVAQQPLVQKEQVVKQVVDKEGYENKSDSVEGKSEAVAGKDIFTFEIDVVAIILMVLLGIMLVKLSNGKSFEEPIRSNRDIPDSIRRYVKDKIKEMESESFGNRGPMNSVYSLNEISRLKDEIFQLKREMEALSQKFDAKKIPFEVIQTKDEDSNLETRKQLVENKTSNEAIYLSTPNIDGGFNDSSSSISYKEGASIYRFIKSSTNEASFQIDDRESSIKMAMQFPEKNILPVCDSENEYEPKFTKVRTIEPGKVSLEGGKWNVKRKAKIRYES
jgi:hypothetical protein